MLPSNRLIETKDFLPPILLDVLRAFRCLVRYPLLRDTLLANRVWQNAFQGERVYVIANGPSLASFDRSELRGRRVIVMNNFERADWKHEVDIVAHCVGEPRSSSAWIDPAENINGTNSASYWFHFSALGKIAGVPEGKKLHYVLAGYEPRVWGRRLVRLHGLAMGYQTTAQLAIQVALYMGFKEVVLLGFDHDWLASPTFSRHFYSSERDSADRLSEYSYYDLIRFSMRMWQVYYALRDAAASHGATIVNKNSGSYLDVFARQLPDG